jgi:hypothetical protein
LAMVQMHEGGVDLLIADAAQADAIVAGLEADKRPRMLRIVEGAVPAPGEITRPFSQQALLEKVAAILLPDGKPPALPESAEVRP